MKNKSDIHNLDFSPLQGESSKIKLMYLIFFIAMAILSPMAIIAWLQGNLILALSDAISAMFLLAILLYHKKTHNDGITIHVGFFFFAFFYLFLFISGGVGNSAFLWIYTFPLFGSFLLGSKKGLIVSISILTIALIYFLITRLSDFHFALYNVDMMIRFFASMLVVILFSYVAERNREFSYNSLEKANSDLGDLTTILTENNKKLTHEISQRKKTESTLLLEKQKADEANRAKSEFLANMSHELRTPLNHIIGFTDLVTSRHCGPLNDSQSEYLGDVLVSSHHLLSLINDILDLAKVEAGRMSLEISNIDLRPFLEQSMNMIREKALKNHLQLTIDIQKSLTSLRGDERKLKQVIYNLLANAAKFTPNGGDISLKASLLEPDDPQLPLGDPQNKWIKISVHDTGLGLKPDDLELVFNTFKQVDSSTSRHYQGTGLGLSLSRNLIELHKGIIWAESPGLGQGSTFSFVLPVFN